MILVITHLLLLPFNAEGFFLFANFSHVGAITCWKHFWNKCGNSLTSEEYEKGVLTFSICCLWNTWIKQQWQKPRAEGRGCGEARAGLRQWKHSHPPLEMRCQEGFGSRKQLLEKSHMKQPLLGCVPQAGGAFRGTPGSSNPCRFGGVF